MKSPAIGEKRRPALEAMKMARKSESPEMVVRRCSWRDPWHERGAMALHRKHTLHMIQSANVGLDCVGHSRTRHRIHVWAEHDGPRGYGAVYYETLEDRTRQVATTPSAAASDRRVTVEDRSLTAPRQPAREYVGRDSFRRGAAARILRVASSSTERVASHLDRPGAMSSTPKPTTRRWLPSARDCATNLVANAPRRILRVMRFSCMPRNSSRVALTGCHE